MQTIKGKIIATKQIKGDFYYTTFLCPEVANTGYAGQFVMVKVNDLSVPLLGRPFGIANIDKANNTFSILYQVVGQGTDILAKQLVGTELQISGPLGRGFSINEKHKSVTIVAGGIGVAPLLYLAKTLREANKEVRFIFGARSEEFLLCLDEIKAMGCELITVTDDGSCGLTGYPHQVLADILAEEKTDFIYTCGRNIMMQRVSEVANAQNIPCEVSLEEHMGCGVGICVSCVCNIEKDGEKSRKRVCHEGPVFAGKDVIWSE